MHDFFIGWNMRWLNSVAIRERQFTAVKERQFTAVKERQFTVFLLAVETLITTLLDCGMICNNIFYEWQYVYFVPNS